LEPAFQHTLGASLGTRLSTAMEAHNEAAMEYLAAQLPREEFVDDSFLDQSLRHVCSCADTEESGPTPTATDASAVTDEAETDIPGTLALGYAAPLRPPIALPLQAALGGSLPAAASQLHRSQSHAASAQMVAEYLHRLQLSPERSIPRPADLQRSFTPRRHRRRLDFKSSSPLSPRAVPVPPWQGSTQRISRVSPGEVPLPSPVLRSRSVIRQIAPRKVPLLCSMPSQAAHTGFLERSTTSSPSARRLSGSARSQVPPAAPACAATALGFRAGSSAQQRAAASIQVAQPPCSVACQLVSAPSQPTAPLVVQRLSSHAQVRQRSEVHRCRSASISVPTSLSASVRTVASAALLRKSPRSPVRERLAAPVQAWSPTATVLDHRRSAGTAQAAEVDASLVGSQTCSSLGASLGASNFQSSFSTAASCPPTPNAAPRKLHASPVGPSHAPSSALKPVLQEVQAHRQRAAEAHVPAKLPVRCPGAASEGAVKEKRPLEVWDKENEQPTLVLGNAVERARDLSCSSDATTLRALQRRVLSTKTPLDVAHA